MGQPVSVIEKPSTRPGVVRFELNRSLSGMGHERFRADQPVSGDRPVDILAQRLFERGGVDTIHINANVVTLELARGASADGCKELIEELYIYYRPGVEIPSFPE